MDERLFLEICKENNYSTEQINLFKGALEFARDKLAQRKRLSGNTYYEHTLRVAEILVQNKAEPQIVVVGLLHSLPKQVDVKRFGEQIIKLLNQVEDLQELKLKHPKLDALALRQIFLTAVRDVRVILVKLASKLDNMRTVNVFSEVEQKRLAGEVLEIYAPLANHLGMDRLKTDLEDVAFKTLNSKKYYQILSFLESSQEQRIKDIAQAIALIKTIAGDKVNIIKIKGRPKHIYSIYKKISRRKVKLHEQYDLLGIRVIVKDIKDCYELLGLLHEKLRSVPGRLKDYIANPKPNFYRSIHTAVLLPDDKRLEIQIRTFEMNEFAETGVAAHWHYKGDKTSESFEKKIAWLRSVLDLQRENKEFLEEVKVDLFGDKIYCYTPKGDVKELPMEATILDFAFMIHEQVGNRAVGGRVNGKFRP
ncbi:hypothetical protein CL620_05365, partial [archaeon]|nr:hypothetical protein [archaeon]